MGAGEIMTETALDHFWQLVFGATPSKLRHLNANSPQVNRVALYVVLIAGFAQASAQGIVLFLNRVKPFRFLLSLLIVPFICLATFSGHLTLIASSILFKGLTSYVVANSGFALQLLMLSFYCLPYLGVPISVLLSVWSFSVFNWFKGGIRTWYLAGIFGVVHWAGLSGDATDHWSVAAIGRWLKNTVAGVNLVTDLKELEQILETEYSVRLATIAAIKNPALKERASGANQR